MDTRVDINDLLSQMRALKARTDGIQMPSEMAEKKSEVSFGSVLKDSIDKVNETQMESAKMSNAFERGEPGVDLTQVMISMQKASVSFQAMTEVRNKLVTAYQEIFNMPI